MRKGFEWSVNLVVMIILLIVAVGVFWGALNPVGYATPENGETESKTCTTNEDCVGNPDGSKCLQIYPGDFVPFCGCVTNVDCGGDICGSDNKCS